MEKKGKRQKGKNEQGKKSRPEEHNSSSKSANAPVLSFHSDFEQCYKLMEVQNIEVWSTGVSHWKRVIDLLLGYIARVIKTTVTCIHLRRAYAVSASNFSYNR